MSSCRATNAKAAEGRLAKVRSLLAGGGEPTDPATKFGERARQVTTTAKGGGEVG